MRKDAPDRDGERTRLCGGFAAERPQKQAAAQRPPPGEWDQIFEALSMNNSLPSSQLTIFPLTWT